MILLITHTDPLAEIGVKTLSAYLRSKGVENSVIYLPSFAHQHLDKSLKEEIAQLARKSKLIGISLMTIHFNVVRDLTQYLRSVCDVPIAWGGIHPSATPVEESLRYCDFVCIGEGEEPLYQLYQSLDSKKYDSIPNLAYKVGDRIVNNGVSFLQLNLDQIPFPNYEFVNDYIYHKGKLVKINSPEISKKELLGEEICVYSQRGCPLSCTYCTNSFLRGLYGKVSKNYFRQASINRLLEDLKKIKEALPDVNRIHILDDDFLARNSEEIAEFARRYKESIRIPLSFTASCKNITEAKIASLKDAPLVKVALGIQSGSDRILKDIYRRPVAKNDIIKAANILSKYQNEIIVSYDIILDNPYEADEDLIDTLNLLNVLPKPYDLSLFTMVFLPGTALTEKAKRDKIIPEHDEFQYNKRYHLDFGKKYLNSIIIMNGIFNLPRWLNAMFASRLLVKSKIFAPVRFLLKNSLGILLCLKGLKLSFRNPRLFLYYLNHLKFWKK